MVWLRVDKNHNLPTSKTIETQVKIPAFFCNFRKGLL